LSYGRINKAISRQPLAIRQQRPPAAAISNRGHQQPRPSATAAISDSG
jgi:hypothetical protein